MSAAKHTPGPWEITDHSDCQLITKDVPPMIGNPIAIGRTYGPNQIANARLIAAAPELLRGANDLLTIVDRIIRSRMLARGELEAIAAIRAAIAKTEGGAA